MARLSTSDAAKMLGVSSQTIRRWLASGRLRGVRDNHGNILVEIEATGVATAATQEATQATPVATSAPEPSIPLEQALEMVEHAKAAHVGELARFQEEVDHRLDQQRADHVAELARVQSLHLDLIGRIQAQAAAERALMLERIDAAELRAERVEARLDQVLDVLLEARKPWWRFWR